MEVIALEHLAQKVERVLDFFVMMETRTRLGTFGILLGQFVPERVVLKTHNVRVYPAMTAMR